jgi:hypothetical protein
MGEALAQGLPGDTLVWLLGRWRVGDTDALFDLVHQAGTALV